MSLDDHLGFLDCVAERAGVSYRDVASSYHLIKRMAIEDYPRYEWNSRRLRLVSYARLRRQYNIDYGVLK